MRQAEKAHVPGSPPPTMGIYTIHPPGGLWLWPTVSVRWLGGGTAICQLRSSSNTEPGPQPSQNHDQDSQGIHRALPRPARWPAWPWATIGGRGYMQGEGGKRLLVNLPPSCIDLCPPRRLFCQVMLKKHEATQLLAFRFLYAEHNAAKSRAITRQAHSSSSSSRSSRARDGRLTAACAQAGWPVPHQKPPFSVV